MISTQVAPPRTERRALFADVIVPRHLAGPFTYTVPCRSDPHCVSAIECSCPSDGRSSKGQWSPSPTSFLMVLTEHASRKFARCSRRGPQQMYLRICSSSHDRWPNSMLRHGDNVSGWCCLRHPNHWRRSATMNYGTRACGTCGSGALLGEDSGTSHDVSGKNRQDFAGHLVVLVLPICCAISRFADGWWRSRTYRLPRQCLSPSQPDRRTRAISASPHHSFLTLQCLGLNHCSRR